MQNDDFQAMAKRFMDAWQDQIAASFRDPEAITRNLQAMQHYTQAYFESLQQPAKENPHGDRFSSAHVSNGGDALRQLQSRMETLERRLSLVEIQLATQPKGKVRKGR